MTNQVELLWPDLRKLSPNIRCHWAAKNKARKKAREAGYWLAKEAKLQPGRHVRLTFHAPDKRPRDLDNCVAAMKSALDGVADAIGQNDREWISIQGEWGDPVKGGKVILQLETGQ